MSVQLMPLSLCQTTIRDILTGIENRDYTQVTNGNGENRVYYDAACDGFYKIGGASVREPYFTSVLQRRLDTELMTMRYAGLLGIATSAQFAGSMVTCQNDNLYHGDTPYHAHWRTISLLYTAKVPGQTVAAFRNQTMDETERQNWLTRAAVKTIVMGVLFNNTDCNSENTLIDTASGAITQIDMAHACFKASSPFEKVMFLSQPGVWWYNQQEQHIKRDTLVDSFRQELHLLEVNKDALPRDHHELMVGRCIQGLDYARTSYRLKPD